MFSQFLDKVDSIVAEAKQSEHVILREYFPIYAAVEDYVRSNNLVLSNVETLVDEKKTSFRSYVVYGDHIFQHANNMANMIAKLTIYVLMYTNKKNEDFSIVVNGTRFIQLFNIQKKLISMIMPVKINNIRMYPPEFELIDIYHKLFLPNFYDEWEMLEGLEIKIRKQMVSRKKVIGGAKQINNVLSTHVPKIHNSIILNWLKDRDDYILIGVNAVNLLNNEDITKKYFQRIQIITSSPSEKIVGEFSQYMVGKTGLEPSAKYRSANFPLEPRLQKIVISVRVPTPKNQKPSTIYLLDIFNAAQFELVPYTTYKHLDVGYPNVFKMFFLLDLWFLRILYAFGFTHQNTLKQYVDEIFNNLNNVDRIHHSKYSSEMYLGVHIDLSRYKQKQGLKNIFYPYNPEQHRYLKGDYRKI